MSAGVGPTCTFVSPALPSAGINGASLIFGFSNQNADFFGIPANFVRDGVDCYSGQNAEPLTSFTPLIVNGQYTQVCNYVPGVGSLYCPDLHNSAFPTGTATLTCLASGNAPCFSTTFVVGGSWTQETTYRTVYTTSTIAAKPEATKTIVVPSSTKILTSFQTTTTDLTVYETTITEDCPRTEEARLKRPAGPSSSATATNPPEISGSLSCPEHHGRTYQDYTIECSTDRPGSDMLMKHTENFEDCIDLCRDTSDCVNVAWIPGKPGSCYLKNDLGPARHDPGVWCAHVKHHGHKTLPIKSEPSAETQASSTTTPLASSTTLTTTSKTSASSSPSVSTSSSTSSSTTSTGPDSSPSIQCPADDGKTVMAPSGATFLIQCNINHQNHDLPGNPVIVDSSYLDRCIAACDATPGCVDVVQSGAACYLKSGVGPVSSQQGAAGAMLISSAPTPLSTVPPAKLLRFARTIKAAASLLPSVGTSKSTSCEDGCSGWSGPESTFVKPAAKTRTITGTIYTAAISNSTATVTSSSGTATVTTDVTATAIKTIYSTVTLTTCPPNVEVVTLTKQVTTTLTGVVDEKVTTTIRGVDEKKITTTVSEISDGKTVKPTSSGTVDEKKKNPSHSNISEDQKGHRQG